MAYAVEDAWAKAGVVIGIFLLKFIKGIVGYKGGL